LRTRLDTFLPRIIKALESRGAAVTPTSTLHQGHAVELARNAVAAGAGLVVIAGGDGTINEAVNGLVHSHVPLAILPLGTANVLATELGTSRSPGAAAAHVPDLVAERISVGLLTPADAPPRYFLMMAGVGLDAHIVLNVDLELKKQLGKLAYWIGGLGQLGRQFPQFNVRVNGSAFKSGFTLASRVRNYGGDLEIAKTASLLDDYFEMVAFEGEDSFRYLKYLTGVMANFLHKMEGVSIYRVRKVEFTPPPGADVLVQVDGDLAGKLPVKLEIVQNALTLLVPRAFRDKHQHLRSNGASPPRL
jgi:diacylglycerol kinase family enzyme